MAIDAAVNASLYKFLRYAVLYGYLVRGHVSREDSINMNFRASSIEVTR